MRDRGPTMECLVHQGDALVGRVALDWGMATSESPPDDGPTIFGPLESTDAYAAIRATCQALRQVLHPDYFQEPSAPATAPAPSANIHALPMKGLDSFIRRRKAIEAAEALALRLTRPDGTLVPTTRVLIEDFTLTDEERARQPPQEGATSEIMRIVEATMSPGAKPPR